MGDYPECDKLRDVAPDSQKLGEFLEWLAEAKGWRLAADVPESTFWRGQYQIEEVTSRRRRGTFFRIKDAEAVFSTYTDGWFDTREEAEAWIDAEEVRRQRVAERNPILRVQPYNMQTLLAEYFDIDLEKVEWERRAVLKAIRS